MYLFKNHGSVAPLNFFKLSFLGRRHVYVWSDLARKSLGKGEEIIMVWLKNLCEATHTHWRSPKKNSFILTNMAVNFTTNSLKYSYLQC